MTATVPVPALLVCLLLAAPAPAMAARPATPDEQVILDHCLAEGASAAECACGLEAAREILTPAEMGVVAALAPDLSQEADLQGALLRAPDLMRQKGMDLGQFVAVMQKVVEHAETVETRCADPDAADR